jgi:hypothetical protein
MPPAAGASGRPGQRHHKPKSDGITKTIPRPRNACRVAKRDNKKLLAGLQPMQAYACVFQDKTGGWFGTSSAGRGDKEVLDGLHGLLTKTSEQCRAEVAARALHIQKIKAEYRQPADAFKGPNKLRKALVKTLLSDLGFLTLRRRWQEHDQAHEPLQHARNLGNKVVDCGEPVIHPGMHGYVSYGPDYGSILDTSTWKPAPDDITEGHSQHIAPGRFLRVSDIMTKDYPPQDAGAQHKPGGFISRMPLCHLLVALTLTLEWRNPGVLVASQWWWYFSTHFIALPFAH